MDRYRAESCIHAAYVLEGYSDMRPAMLTSLPPCALGEDCTILVLLPATRLLAGRSITLSRLLGLLLSLCAIILGRWGQNRLLLLWLNDCDRVWKTLASCLLASGIIW